MRGTMEKLTPLSKVMIAAIVAGAGVTAFRTYGGYLPSVTPEASPSAAASVLAPAASVAAAGTPAKKPRVPFPKRPVKVALSQWPGHMPLLIAAGVGFLIGLAVRRRRDD